MGKLHDNVKFLNYLKNNLDDLRLDFNIKEKFLVLEKIKRLFPEQLNAIDSIFNSFLSLQAQELQLAKVINDKISNIEKEIDELACRLLNEIDYKELFNELHFQEPRKSYELVVTSDIRRLIESKITSYCDWHFPALNINSTDKTWIDVMVTADPLYLAHTNIRLVKDMISSYPELYQNRLRLYEITDRKFSKLPQNQFSFIFCWNSLNYLSSDKVEQYLTECWSLLRPGGIFLFSYSNCDLEGTALRSELNLCAYCNSRWISHVSRKLGFEITDLYDLPTGDTFNTHVSYAELKKPGNLNTIKVAQAMAQILFK